MFGGQQHGNHVEIPRGHVSVYLLHDYAMILEGQMDVGHRLTSHQTGIYLELRFNSFRS